MPQPELAVSRSEKELKVLARNIEALSRHENVLNQQDADIDSSNSGVDLPQLNPVKTTLSKAQQKDEL